MDNNLLPYEYLYPPPPPLSFLIQRRFTCSSIHAAIFERFRGILHEGEIDKRVQFLIEGLFAIRKAKFQVKLYLLSPGVFQLHAHSMF